MTETRISVQDFALANPIYKGARVTFWTIDANGAKTTIAATLYDSPSGSTTVSNPQTLDGEGKLRAPIYINTPVIATVAGRNIDSHDTGIIGTVFVSGMSLPGGTAGQIPIVSSGLALVCRAISGAITIDQFGVVTLTPLGADDLTNGTEGSGPVVLQTNPQLITPHLGAALADTINGLAITAAIGSTLRIDDGKVVRVSNSIRLLGTDGREYTFPAANGNVCTDDSTKALTNTTFDSAATGNVMKVGGVAISRGQFPASNTNDSATAGNIGQSVSSSVTAGSPVALVTTAAKTITSISLPAGDWDVALNGVLTPTGGANVTVAFVSISQVNNTLDVNPGLFNQVSYPAAGVVPSSNLTITCPSVRISLASTTTIYFVARGDFTVGPLSAWGMISARRAR